MSLFEWNEMNIQKSVNTLAVDEVYRSHRSLVQVMPPSMQVLLDNTQK